MSKITIGWAVKDIDEEDPSLAWACAEEDGVCWVDRNKRDVFDTREDAERLAGTARDFASAGRVAVVRIVRTIKRADIKHANELAEAKTKAYREGMRHARNDAADALEELAKLVREGNIGCPF
jgi:ribosomal protein L7/L12